MFFFHAAKRGVLLHKLNHVSKGLGLVIIALLVRNEIANHFALFHHEFFNTALTAIYFRRKLSSKSFASSGKGPNRSINFCSKARSLVQNRNLHRKRANKNQMMLSLLRFFWIYSIILDFSICIVLLLRYYYPFEKNSGL
jgi:hypothetical protein